MSRIVAALGGSVLIRRGDEGSTAVQRHNLLGAAQALARLESLGHGLVLTHGNGEDAVDILDVRAGTTLVDAAVRRLRDRAWPNTTRLHADRPMDL